MKKNVTWRFTIIIITVILAVVFFLPNTQLFKYMPDFYKEVMPDKGISLGLDLRGGIHLVYEVEGDKAVEESINRMANNIRNLLDKKEIKPEIRVEGAKLIINYESATKTSSEQTESQEKQPSVVDITSVIQKTVENNYANLTLKETDPELVFIIPSKEVKRIADNATEQALEIIRNRIDQRGVKEPIIQRQGENEIIVQLPGEKDPKGAITLIGKTAQLKFKLVDDDSPVAAEIPESISSGEEDRLKKEFSEKIPSEDEILFQRVVSNTGEIFKRPYLIKKETLLTGALLSEARTSIDSRFNDYYVSIKFNAEGAKLFEEVTGKYAKKRLAIILDNNVYSAPVIQERISGGDAQISGTFTLVEARDLSIVLKSGSLPAPVKMLQNVTVGPSLGRDSIEAGRIAGIIAIILVVIFMIIYYRLSGLIADFALVLNVVLLLGVMAALNATLTMPGIAGIILAVGMAVDTNVLMFERIREELRTGKTPRAAVDSGYDKAFLTIVDSHVTTLITAVVLYQFGTGPIKGFAVTLSLGVAINLFTALIGTKSVFDLINSRREVRKLSI